MADIINKKIKCNEGEAMIDLKMLPASYGDCFLLTIKDKEKNINILIDGGLAQTYDLYLKQLLSELGKKGEKLDIVINTHIDSDHIKGLISFLKENNKDKFIEIGDLWFNGLEQITSSYPDSESKATSEDEKIIDNIIRKGYEDEFQQTEKISSKEGCSLSGLIECGGYNHNKVSEGKAITDVLDKIKVAENVSIKIIAPTKVELTRLESKWFDELESKNFYFTMPKDEKLANSFEFLVSRLKTYYLAFKSKVSSAGDIDLYLSELDNEDTSVVNGSSIAFVLEVYDKKFLFLGDAIVKNREKCKIIQNLIDEYGENLEFELIKLPHHGSNCNITKDFINLTSAKEYIISTNSLRYGHPDLDVIANLIIKKHEKKLIFNYKIKQAILVDHEEWKNKYKYEVVVGTGNQIIERIY